MEYANQMKELTEHSVSDYRSECIQYMYVYLHARY